MKFKILTWASLLCFIGVIAIFIRKFPQSRGEIRTQISQSDKALRFFALGDSGNGSTQQYQVAQAMELQCQKLGGIDGILLLGDNFYMSGVDSVDDPQWEEKILKPYGSPCLSKAEIYPILGNHDYRGNPQAQVDYSLKSTRWKMPHRFYSVNFGSLLKIVAMDSTIFDFCGLSNFCAIDFLLKELSSPDQQWKFVLSHHPLTSASVKGGNYNGDGPYGHLMRWLTCDKKLDLLFAGHTHHLEHRKLPNCNPDFFISGGGGMNIASDLKNSEIDSKFSAKSHGFLSVDITPESIHSQFFDSQAKLLYETKRIH